MHVSIYLNTSDAELLEQLGERFETTPSAVAKHVLAAVLRGDLTDAVLDGALPPKRPRGQPWTSPEVEYLRSRRRSRMSYGDIAKNLGRSRSSVISKASQLGLLGNG